MVPLVIGDLLQWAGVPGSVAIVVSALIAAYHFRSILQMLSTLGFVAKVSAGIAVVFVALWAGVIPGIDVDVSVAFDTVAGFLSSLVEFIGNIVGLIL